MQGIITKPLSKEQALELFEKESILLGNDNAIPQFRVVELFGEYAAEFIDRNIKYNGYLVSGIDHNAMGSCDEEHPLMHYFYWRGFKKIVVNFNYELSLRTEKESKAKPVIDDLWNARAKRLD